MRRGIATITAVLALACGSSRGGSSSQTGSCPSCDLHPPPTAQTRGPWPQGRSAGYTNPIPRENARPGDPAWRQGTSAGAHQLEAYLDRVSARAGDAVGVAVNVDAPHDVRWVLYRVGWYGGAGARRVAGGGPVRISPQAPCPPRAEDGLIQCAWDVAFQVPVAADAVSGYHVVKLIRDDGLVSMAPLVVVDDRPADLLAQASVNTWEAYNAWGGESLYRDDAHLVPGGFALRVSYDRPFLAAGGLGAADDGELAFARFLERHGYDVSYTTDVDVALLGAAHVARAGAFLSVGHDEYWAGENRDALEAARDFGVPLAFFGANAGYWKVRLEAPGAGAQPRVITCYKSARVTDPVTGPETTGRFRDPPVNRPESALVGVMYESWLLLAYPLVVADGSSWVFDGTGLRSGDALPGVVGDEYDFAPGAALRPATLEVVARSPVLDAEGKPSFASAAWYRAASGALVFAAGTIAWSRALDPASDSYDGRVERMTANVFHAALGLPVPATVSSDARAASSVYGATPAGPAARSVTTRAVALGTLGGVAALPGGAVAFVDPQRHEVLQVDASGGVTALAGDGEPGQGPAFDGVPGARARFLYPTALLALPDGSLLVADTGNACLRRIGGDPDHTVTTFAGLMGAPGLVDGPAAQARFRFPMGLARDPASGVVYVADSANHRVRAVDAAGNVTTLAGSVAGDADGPGATARLYFPTAVAVGPDGRVYVVTSPTAEVKAIGTDAAHTVVTLAGGGEGTADGPGTAARLAPQGGAVWAAGVLLVSDPANRRVRAVVPGAGAADTTVHTFAGSGAFGATDGAASDARFGMPAGLAVAADGTVYVADPGVGALRVIQP